MSFIASPLSYLRLQRYINPTTWISDIVYCVYSVVFTSYYYSGVFIVSTTGALWRGKFCIYYSGSETAEIVTTPDVLRRGKICIYYRGSEIPAIKTATVVLWRKHIVYTIAV